MNFLKGFVIGIGKIIPGVSGAVLAIIMGVYDKAIYYICNFKSNVYEGSKYLVSLGIGIIVSIILFSKIISYCLSEYYVITMLFFIGRIKIYPFVGSIKFFYLIDSEFTYSILKNSI